MTPIAYLNHAKSNNVAILSAFAQGSGAETTTELKLLPGRPAVLYGVDRVTLSLWNEIVRTGHPYIYIDNGYMRSKWHGGDYYRITRNAPQHSGLGASDGHRFRALGLHMAPWRTDGAHILIACQSDFWHERNCGMNAEQYAERVTGSLLGYTKRPIIVRHKPKSGKSDTNMLTGDLYRCWAVVTHSSMVALEAILAGVPSFVLAKCAISPMARESLVTIETPYYPTDRERWIDVLADNQFSLPEIRNGTAWAALNV